MHWCSASITTPTPLGFRCVSRQSAICWVSRSWTCSPRANCSTTRASLDSPGQPARREVAYVRDAVEGQHVMLALRPEGDVPGQDELVVPFVIGERGELERAWAEHFDIRRRDPASPPRRQPSARPSKRQAFSASGSSGQ
jgi:hypothetical protein